LIVDMPRARLSARSWLLAVALSVGAAGAVARAAPPAAAGRREAANAGGARATSPEARRREEIDALQRQDAADALKRHFNIDIDWRTTPLDRLIDVRARAAKAADLQLRLGVVVDWQRYSWIELEALRRTLLSFEEYRNEGPAPAATTAAPPAEVAAGPAADTDGLVRPTFKGRLEGRPGRSTDPDGIIRPTFAGRADGAGEARDPDGVIRPTFAARPRWSSASADPDGLIAPTFAPPRRFAPIGDADDLIDPTRMQDNRSVPARW
jgi:hypothetical protein